MTREALLDALSFGPFVAGLVSLPFVLPIVLADNTPTAHAEPIAPLPVVHVHEPSEVRAAAGRFFRELDPDADDPHVSCSFAVEPPRCWAFVSGTLIVADCEDTGCVPRCER